jgi:type VI secretion system protein ImpG
MMEDLLPFYERELGFMRNASREFAKRYPKITAGLGLSGENCEDPHVERLIEAFALLTARVNKKIDDDYPEFTEALLEVLYPHYLRPFPSCSIAQFDLGARAVELKNVLTVPRKTYLKSRPVRKVPCVFRTVYDVDLSPLLIDSIRYYAAPMTPSGISIPPETTARLSLTLKLADPAALLKSVASLGKLRIYLHGETSLVATLRDCFFMNVCKAFLETSSGVWQPLKKIPVAQAGFGDDEAVLDFPASSHPAYRLLMEHFAFPEKFNFVDLPLDEIMEEAGHLNKIVLHFLIKGIPADSNTARLLETVSTDNLRLHCSPIVNLFEMHADPIRVTQKVHEYPVVAGGRAAYGYEVYSIDKVLEVRESPSNEDVVEVRPFFSLRHGEGEDRDGGYWTLSRDPAIEEKSPGYETQISIVDSEFNPMTPRVDTLSVQMTCSNRDLPALLSASPSEGDLLLEGGAVEAIHLMRRPTPARRFSKGRGVQWRLISHLSLNHLSMTETGLPALKETLHLYNLSNSAVFTRQIEGLLHLDSRPATLWLEGEPFATFIRGVEIHLTLNPDNFVGTSLHTFISVLNRFFSLYVHINSFIQLVILDPNGLEIMRCAPCSGDAILV